MIKKDPSKRDTSKVRYAVVGAGNITQVAVLPAFAHAKKTCELVAIVSGDAEKRAELRKRYDIEVDGDYDELESVLERAEVDAVYIATPNADHKALVLRAAAAGVHVLCEKPLTTSVADARDVIDACDRAGVKLMVAYRLHFEEASLKAIEIAKSGKLGEPRIFDSFFSHVVRPDDIRQQAEAGGGAVLDLGVYCINAARNLFQAEPIEVFATVQEKDGVDDTTTAILRFPGERVAMFTVSNSTAGVSSYRIAGSKGDLRVEPAYEYSERLEHHLTIEGKTKTESFSKRDQFAPELEYFARCILEDRTPEPDGHEGLHDLRVIEAVLESAKQRHAIRLEPLQDTRYPTMAQEDKKPPVGKQRTVNAPSPSLK
jgi:predicted dehydrogenase